MVKWPKEGAGCCLDNVDNWFKFETCLSNSAEFKLGRPCKNQEFVKLKAQYLRNSDKTDDMQITITSNGNSCSSFTIGQSFNSHAKSTEVHKVP